MIPKKEFLVADTETVGLGNRALIYDIAWRIIDRKGNKKHSENYLVREIITDGDKMTGAYFAKKIFSFYIEKIETGEIEILNFADIVDRLRESVRQAKVFSAYNLPFDSGAIRATMAALNIPGKILTAHNDTLCLWNFACDTALSSRLYNDYARAHGLVSEAGNVRTTAEATYRYLTGNPEFIESHTAAHDAKIESYILSRLLRRKETIPYNQVDFMPWRKAQIDT